MSVVRIFWLLTSAVCRSAEVSRTALSTSALCIAVGGLSTWNSLPDTLRDLELSLATLSKPTKHILFAKYLRQNAMNAFKIFE